MLWKLQVMLSADEIRNALQAVVWMYLSAEVRHKMVKQYCTGYEWRFDSSNRRWCDTVEGMHLNLGLSLVDTTSIKVR